MGWNTVVNFPIAFYGFFVPAFKTTNNAFFAFFLFKNSFQEKEVLVELYALYRRRVEVAFSKTQVVNRVKDIGFSHTVFTDKTIDSGIESIVRSRYVFIVG